MHTVLVDTEEKVALLLTSANARYSTPVDRRIIGCANRHLHYFEMEYLQSIGILKYDLGGYATDAEIAIDSRKKGVNDFKMSFGGKIEDNIVYETISFWLLRRLGRMIGVIHSNSSMQQKQN